MALSIVTQSQNVASNNSSTALSNEDTDTTETDTTSSSSGTAEQFDTFLTLLTAQIRNQDPLAPLDSTQFVEQLATFSNLELQAESNKILESIASMLTQQLATTTEDADA